MVAVAQRQRRECACAYTCALALHPQLQQHQHRSEERARDLCTCMHGKPAAGSCRPSCTQSATPPPKSPYTHASAPACPLSRARPLPTCFMTSENDMASSMPGIEPASSVRKESCARQHAQAPSCVHTHTLNHNACMHACVRASGRTAPPSASYSARMPQHGREDSAAVIVWVCKAALLQGLL